MRWVLSSAIAAIPEVPVPAIVGARGVIGEVDRYTGTGAGDVGVEVGLGLGQNRYIVILVSTSSHQSLFTPRITV